MISMFMVLCLDGHTSAKLYFRGETGDVRTEGHSQAAAADCRGRLFFKRKCGLLFFPSENVSKVVRHTKCRHTRNCLFIFAGDNPATAI
jgi:hypothetical protein